MSKGAPAHVENKPRLYVRLNHLSGGVAARQRGQVMPMTIVFIGAVILALWVMYDSGQLMTEKIKLQNTADNVAYSTATLVSRDLNFIAYTNRGMVANQVAIAQVVGLSSYIKLLEQFAINVDTLVQYLQIAIPVFGTGAGAVVRSYTATIRSGASSVSAGFDGLAEVVIPINNKLIEGLSVGQHGFHEATQLLVGNLSREVGELNDPDARSFFQVGNSTSLVEPAALYEEWSKNIGPQFELQQASDSSQNAQVANNRFGEFEKVVTDSRDTFSTERSYVWDIPPFTARFDPFPARINTRTNKYGGSEFVRGIDPSSGEYKWDWTAMDTVSLYAQFCIFKPGLPPGYDCSNYDEVLPLGWGAAHSLDEDDNSNYFNYTARFPGRSRNSQWGGAWRNDISAGLGAADDANHALSEISGLQNFYDFQETGTGHDFGPAVMSIYVKDDKFIGSQRSLIEGAGGTVADEFDTESSGALLNNRIVAAAKARPYFSRATDLALFARADRRYEHGNLYNPFWQPRLVDLTDDEKNAIAVAVSGTAVASVAP